jgi:hypothetical protein
LFSDLELLLFVYNKKINISDIGYISEVNTVNTYKDLLSIIKQFDETLVCQGAIPSNKINDINSSYGYQFVESYGVWRHIKCHTILTKDDYINRLLILNLNIILYLQLTIYCFKISVIFVYGVDVCGILYKKEDYA